MRKPDPSYLEENAFVLSKESYWRKASADRLNVLIDAKSYYQELADAIEKAERSIYIMGWDLDTQIRLRPLEVNFRRENFANLIERQLDKKPNLEIYILIWKFFLLFSHKRKLPPFRTEWLNHPRLHFTFERDRPIESSQHEKLVVIDRRLSFIGNTDISRERWDDVGHTQYRKLRRNPEGEPYRPHHDLQAMMEGEVVHELASYFEAAWKRETGHEIQSQKNKSSSLWPAQLTPDFKDVELYLSRSAPEFASRQRINELESSILEIIQTADNLILIEMQYLSAAKIDAALMKRLQENSGPVVLIILPKEQDSLIEKYIMSVLQNRQLKKLRSKDKFRRLGIYYPALSGKEKDQLMIHSKLLVADDRFLHLGSGNFNQRSMSLDSELAFNLYAKTDSQRKAVRHFCSRLLSEHTGEKPELIENLLENPRQLLEWIERRQKCIPSLRKLPAVEMDSFVSEIIDGEYCDPDAPFASKELGDLGEKTDSRRRFWILFVSLILACVGLAVAWQVLPLEEWIKNFLFSLHQKKSFLVVLGILVSMAVASALMMPITLITLACLLFLGPWWGMSAAMGVSLLGASISYLIGRWINEKYLGLLLGKRLSRVVEKFRDVRSLTMVVLIRFIPIAPFGMVNLAAGASRVPFLYFIVGSFIGLLPAKILLAVFSDRFFSLIKNPTWEAIAWLIGISILTIGLVYISSKGLERRYASAKTDN